MDVRVTWKYTIDLTKEEFLLLSKALRGNLKDEEKAACLTLQERMVAQKHGILQQALDESAKVIVNIENRKI